MQSRGWSGSTGLSAQRQLEERGCKRPLRSNSDEAAPTENPGCLSTWAERRRGRGTGAREHAEEGGGFGVPAAANLKPKDDQAALPAAVELGIGLPAFAPGSCAHSKAWLGLFAGAWFAIPRNRANQRSVDGKLVTMPEREAVAYDLDAPSWIGTSRFMAANLKCVCTADPHKSRSVLRPFVRTKHGPCARMTLPGPLKHDPCARMTRHTCGSSTICKEAFGF